MAVGDRGVRCTIFPPPKQKPVRKSDGSPSLGSFGFHVSGLNSEFSDDDLVERAGAGDAEALQALVERWQGPVFAFMLRMVGSPEDAQDLTQEAFMRVCQSAHRYRACGQFKSWIFRIAGNIARTRLRRAGILRWVRFDVAAHNSPSRSTTAESALEELETKHTVRSALLALPPRQREAVALRYFEEMSHQETADAMNVSVSAVESLLHRAMTALRESRLLKDTRA